MADNASGDPAGEAKSDEKLAKEAAKEAKKQEKLAKLAAKQAKLQEQKDKKSGDNNEVIMKPQ